MIWHCIYTGGIVSRAGLLGFVIPQEELELQSIIAIALVILVSVGASANVP